MGEYYGDFVRLKPCHFGCNDCGTEYWSIAELRWCPECQYNIWDEGMDEYRRLRSQIHTPANNWITEEGELKWVIE